MLNTKGQNMKKSNSLTGNVTIKQGQRDILLDIKRQYMKAATNKLQNVFKKTFHEGVKYQCRQCDYLASSVGSLAEHKMTVHEGVKYRCRQCNHQTILESYLAQHKRAVFEGVRYPCGQCSH